MLRPLTVTLRSAGAAPAAPAASVVVSSSISRKFFQRILDDLLAGLLRRRAIFQNLRLVCADDNKARRRAFVRLWTIAFGAQQFILAATFTRKQPSHAPRRRTRKQ